jgi:hypothetical protein
LEKEDGSNVKQIVSNLIVSIIPGQFKLLVEDGEWKKDV